MLNLNWSRKELTPQKLGAFGEYYAKMVLASYGADIYTSEVDDHGIDFIAETKHGFLKFQVKAVRSKTNYVFMKAKDFNPSDSSLYLLLVLLDDGKDPDLYAIPASAWNDPTRSMLVYHAYQIPEYGINLSRKNMPQLEDFTIRNMAGNLF